MKVEAIRIAGDQFRLRLTFSNDEQLDIKIRRAQLLEQLDVGDDES